MTCFLLGNKRFSAAIAIDLLWVHVRDNLRMLVLMFLLKEGDAHVNAIFLCQVPRLCFVGKLSFSDVRVNRDQMHLTLEHQDFSLPFLSL